MKDLNVVREKALNIINLSEKMDDIFDVENHKEHLITAIMAGLQDSYNQGYNDGYCQRPA